MTRAALVFSLVTVLVGYATACGDTQGNVIERVTRASDAGAGGSAPCTTPGGCAGAGGAPAGECTTNTDCTSPVKTLCNVGTHTCAECLLDDDCVDRTETCSVVLNRCAAPCSSDADCGFDDPKCDLALGRAGTPGYCVGCRQVTDCTDPERPFCVEGDCVACADGQC